MLALVRLKFKMEYLLDNYLDSPEKIKNIKKINFKKILNNVIKLIKEYKN